MKTICDMQPETKVAATGSASPAIVKGEAGRWSVIQVPTMLSYKYCELLNVEKPELDKSLRSTQRIKLSHIEFTDMFLTTILTTIKIKKDVIR